MEPKNDGFQVQFISYSCWCHFQLNHIKLWKGKQLPNIDTRWAPDPVVSRLISPLVGVITQLLTGSGAHLLLPKMPRCSTHSSLWRRAYPSCSVKIGRPVTTKNQDNRTGGNSHIPPGEKEYHLQTCL